MEFIEKGINENTTTIGYFQTLSQTTYKVYISDDGEYKSPNLYIKKVDNSFCTCISLETPVYFIKNLSLLNENEITALLNFLKGPTKQPQFQYKKKSYKLKTIWDYTIICWNVENDITNNKKFDISMDENGYLISPPIPDYKKLL